MCMSWIWICIWIHSSNPAKLLKRRSFSKAFQESCLGHSSVFRHFQQLNRNKLQDNFWRVAGFLINIWEYLIKLFENIRVFNYTNQIIPSYLVILSRLQKLHKSSTFYFVKWVLMKMYHTNGSSYRKLFLIKYLP